MTSAVTKKLLLVGLAIVAGYIWWGNIATFFSSESSVNADPRTSPTPRMTVTTDGSPQLDYLGIKINPFRRNLPTAPPPKTPARGRNVPPPPPPLSSTASLSGILDRGAASQAVVLMSDGRSFVLAVHDTLADWELTNLAAGFAVFTQGKYHDTLRLGPTTR